MFEILSRVQFAVTITYHFIFVPLTIGLILLIGILEIMYFRTKDDKYRKLSDYFGNIFIVNYAIGIVTGITMSIQFGTNWANYSAFMGDVFGAPLALEALIAFFLESTFTGIYIFRRNKMSPKFRLVTVWLIMAGTFISALWIITANGFMQNPVGYELLADGSKVILTDIWAMIFNPYAWYILIHNNASAFILGGFFVLSVSCYKLLKNDITEEERDAFSIAARIGAIVAFFSSLLTMIIGSKFFGFIAPIQPHKIAAISGDNLFVRISFIVMVALGTFFLLTSLYVIVFKNKFLGSTVLKKIFVWSFILPYIAIMAGWMVSEVGRQPWVVNGLLKTADGVSTGIDVSQVWFSLLTTSLLYIFVLVIIVYFILIQVKNSLDKVKYVYDVKEKNE
ncbi:MAG: cytochrome ubiquinol oxidase subunit I [Mycoplasmatales bacterium]